MINEIYHSERQNNKKNNVLSKDNFSHTKFHK